jgi:SEC-C motif-containing protein
MKSAPMTNSCPCGSHLLYADCCQRFHHQHKHAPTPEALMRSRYSAFVLERTDYLYASWHPDTRPASLALDDNPAWASLQILNSNENGNRGTVHFRAIYRRGNGWGYLEEHSDFIRENHRWYYYNGTPHEGILKPGRNDPCPCGSGKKFKACCL